MKYSTYSWLFLVFILFGLVGHSSGYAQQLAFLSQASEPEQQAQQSLKSILERLQSEFDVDFTYRSEVLEQKQVLPPTLDADEDLDQLLDKLLKPFDLAYQKEGRYYLIFPEVKRVKVPKLENVPDRPTSGTVPADLPNMVPKKVPKGNWYSRLQEKNISGQVTDFASGEALPGVNIIVKGTTIGTVTNVEGNYNLTAPDNAETLVFSSVGYNTEEVAIGNRTVVNLEMTPDIQSLSEIVVVGYGTQERRDITGAVASVKEEDIKNMAIQSVDQALQGRAPGVVVTQNSAEPGGAVSVRIRGVGSTGNNEPLYVIDGFPIDNDAGLGSAGNSDNNFNPLATLNPNDIESIEILKDASAAAIYGARAANGVVLITTKRGRNGDAVITLDAYGGLQEAWKVPDFLNAEQFATLSNEVYTNADLEVNPEWANPSNLGEGTDWMDEMFRTAPIQSYNLSVRGGNEKVQAAVSAGYFNQQGILISSGFERYSLRANVDYTATDRLKIGNSLQVSYSDQDVLRTSNFSNGVFNIAMMAHPTVAPDGIMEGQALYLQNDLDNPVFLANDIDETLNVARLLSTMFAEYTILDGLTYKINLGADLLYSNSQRWNPQIDRGVRQDPLASSSSRTSQDITWLIEHTLNYNKSFGMHNLNLLAGFTSQQSNFEALNGSGSGFQNNDIRVISASNSELRNAGGTADVWSLVSYIGRVNYDFNKKYLLSASMRVDGSSRFGPENRYGVFPSFSAGWRLSQEPFMSNVGFIDDLKLRGSWGQLGSDRIGNFGYLNVYTVGGIEYTFGGGPQSGLPGATLQRLGNPGIRWETSTQTDIGLDAALFGGRVTLAVDYFIKDTDDLLVAVPIPFTAGIPRNPIVNAGSVRNQGLELAVGYRKSSGDFTYDINANLATLQNEVTSLGDGQPIFSGSGNRFNETKTEVGQPIGYFFGYVVDGIYQTQEEADADAEFRPQVQPGDFKFRDIDGDGVFTEEDRTNLGNPFPDLTYGLNVSLGYKNLDFTMFWQGISGNEIFSTIKQQAYQIPYFNGSGVTNSLAVMMDRWNGPGTSNSIPRLDYNDSRNYPFASSFYIEDGSFTRLRNLEIGYTLPDTFTQTIGITNARIYIGGQNLLTLTEYSLFDPEIGETNQNPLTRGIDEGAYPVARTYKLGINVTF